MHLLNEYDLLLLLHSLTKWKIDTEREREEEDGVFLSCFIFILNANARLPLIESSRAGCDLT